MSLTATTSRVLPSRPCSTRARKTSRPMRPNRLIPTLAAIAELLRCTQPFIFVWAPRFPELRPFARRLVLYDPVAGLAIGQYPITYGFSTVGSRVKKHFHRQSQFHPGGANMA